jgi:hypothetical protein
MDGSSGAGGLLASAGATPARAGFVSVPGPVVPLEFVDRFAMKVDRSS